jgi:hypothetical protein
MTLESARIMTALRWAGAAGFKTWSARRPPQHLAHIKDCYGALVKVFEPGDRLFLFSFSRGAYTVRSLGGVLKLCGVPLRDAQGRSSRENRDARLALVHEAVENGLQNLWPRCRHTREAASARPRVPALRTVRQRSVFGHPEYTRRGPVRETTHLSSRR